MKKKLLVIGLDGYEAGVADRMMREGKLPALAALTRRSAQVNLDHGAAKRTGLAWEHFSTGLAPDAAERWSAVHFDPATYRCVQKGTAQRPFPAGLAAKTVVFDPPYFDLARAPEVRGIVAWGAHDPGTKLTGNPAGLIAEARERGGDYPADPWTYGFTWPSAARSERMGDALIAAVKHRERTARWLLQERATDWDLAIVVVSELHSALEALWHGMDEGHPLHGHASAAAARRGVEGVYEAVDDFVESLVRSCPDVAVLAFSMHGMGPNESDVASMALLAELMYRRQFGEELLRASQGASEIAAGVPGLGAEDHDWAKHVRACFSGSFEAPERSPRASAKHVLGRLLPEPLKRKLRAGPTSHSLDWMPAAWYSRYWRDMDAFALPSFYDGQIRVNLRGREADGRVALADYDATLQSIEDTIRACVDPRTGRSVVREIVRTHRGDPLGLGPTEADLIVVWEGASLAFAHPELGTLGPLPYRRTGGHTGPHGIALLSGSGIAPGFYGERSAFDVVPTILEHIAASADRKLSGASFLSLVTRAAPA